MSFKNLKEFIPGLDVELKKQTALWVTRLVVNLVGSALIAIGAVTQDQVDNWVNAHLLELAGFVLTVAGAVWGYLNTRKNVVKLGVAIGMDPTKADGETTGVHDVHQVLKK